MDVSILVAAAAYLAAEVGRKPGDTFALSLWDKVGPAVGRILNRPPVPGDLTGATIRAASTAEPGVTPALEAARQRSTGLRRAELVERVLRGAHILWLDDELRASAWEREIFHSLGASTVPVDDTSAAVARLGTDTFHLTVTTSEQGADAIRQASAAVPIVFYGGADEPNELIHLALDRLERTRI
jgi:hypothetical protein